ncbi:MAG: MTAP family purine nucleoside phosphorylase [Gammaproteobacteria bacterium]
MWALIGGSGFENFSDVEILEELPTATPFGACSSGFKRIRIHENELLFLPRHGHAHELIPSSVNYRANIFILKKYGAKAIISTSSVGSLDATLKPGEVVIPNQFIDRTKGIRAHTFCDNGIASHVSLAEPVSPELVNLVKDISSSIEFNIHFDKTYLCIEGPAFSTRAESLLYVNLGAAIIGMTAFPEYALAREAGLSYLSCCFVTDYDSWDPSITHVTIQEVKNILAKNNLKAFELISNIIITPLNLLELSAGNLSLQKSLIVPYYNLTKDQESWLSIITQE